MFCPQCGNSVSPSSRFCPACGASIAASAVPPPPPPPNAYPGSYPGSNGDPYAGSGQITRPRNNRMIAGVCAGFALHFGWDLNLVRILTALFIVLTGIGAIVYIAAWVILPEAPYALPVKSS
jgi:phage shock protein C